MKVINTNFNFLNNVFKEYDVRGIFPEEINNKFAYFFGRAIADISNLKNIKNLVIGYDCRVSSFKIFNCLKSGISDGGINILDIGNVPTPLVYYAIKFYNINSGISITGSHNPKNYNGFKVIIDNNFLYGKDFKNIKKIMLFHMINNRKKINGITNKITIMNSYISRINRDINLCKKIKIIIDSGNGITGFIAPKVLKKIGCKVTEIFSKIDGNFPNHHPDPSNKKNLNDIIFYLKKSDNELGVSLDGDGDRSIIITKYGNIIYPDRQLIIFSKDILSINNNKNKVIIYDIKCSKNVENAIKYFGGKSLIYITGHSYLKNKISKINAILAGEMSGHIFFNDRWFGFDDGIYTASRMIEILSRHTFPSYYLSSLPHSFSIPEIKIYMNRKESLNLIKKIKDKWNFQKFKKIITIDGIRIGYPYGFCLIKISNTMPFIILRFEGNSKKTLIYIKNNLLKQLIKFNEKFKYFKHMSN